MDLRIETVKLTAGGIVSAVLAVLGSNYRLVILLIAFMAVDTLFGHLRAIKDKEWTSGNARWGLIGKLVELVLIALMYMCEWCFGIDWLVNAVVMYFIVCEGASIIENIVKGHLNDNVPAEAAEVLEKAKTNAVQKVIKRMKELFGGGDDEDNPKNGSD